MITNFVTMFDKLERFVGVFVVFMAFLVFWSPILVIVSVIVLIVFLFLKSKYFKKESNVQLLKTKNRLQTNQMTNENRFVPNVRQIKTARRQLPISSGTVDNYFANYSINTLNANDFLQSESIFSSMSGQSFVSRPQSANDMSYSPSMHRLIRESPMSQLGNLPYVKLMNSGSETSSHEMKTKPSPVKPVTVRIAPMPQNLSKFTLNRISNPNTTHVSTLGPIDSTFEASTSSTTDTKNVVDALKKSLRRKREPKMDFDFEDNPNVATNKRQKRDSNESISIPNGTIPSNKPSAKRQANEMTELLHKRFKNNEILSSYSSLQLPQLSQTFKNKRKLSPDLKESIEVKSKKISEINPNSEETNFNLKLNVEDDRQFRFTQTNDMAINFNATVNEEPVERVPKKSYGLPLHLHSMEDHERDRSKARHRLNRFLNAVKEVSSPTSDDNLVTELTVQTTESTTSSSEIDLPTVPAIPIFTTSRVETSVTTTLLNTPISSVLTTTKESISPQNISIDSAEPSPTRCVPSSLPSSLPSTVSLSLPSWPQNTVPTITLALTPSTLAPTLPLTQPTLFTATAAPAQSLFSVGTGGSTTRRIASNSRLRARQKR